MSPAYIANGSSIFSPVNMTSNRVIHWKKHTINNQNKKMEAAYLSYKQQMEQQVKLGYHFHQVLSWNFSVLWSSPKTLLQS